MAEEKKPSNLKDRLKKTQMSPAGAGAPGLGPVAPPGAGVLPGVPGLDPTTGAAPADAPPFAAPPIPGLAPPVAPPMGGVPGIPGFGADIAPPAFVQEQQAQEAARQRAAAAAAAQAAAVQAAAADPFASAYSAPAGPQELRLVIDEKPVDDKEVGRQKTGNIIAIIATAVVALGAGWGLGGLVSDKKQNEAALRAVHDIRGDVTRVAEVLATARQKIDHAAEAGNIRVQRGEDDQPAAATHPPTVDEELLTWIREQQPEPPFSPSIFAGRAGRLNPNLVAKLTLLSLQVNNLWQSLMEHGRRTNVAQVRESLNYITPATSELARTYVVFSANNDGLFATLAPATGAPDAQGNLSFPAAQGQPAVSRQLYRGAAPLPNVQAFATAAVKLQPTPMLINAGAGRWREYGERIRELKGIAEELANTLEQLQQQLSGGSGGGH